MLKILRHAAAPAPTAIAIGSFDGVHLGHQAMLAHVCAAAKARGLASAALTFEPLPREFFAPREAPARLSSLAEKLAAIEATGIGIAWVQRFERRFAALTAEGFERRLHDHHGARWVMVGQDFRYGAGRKGDSASLAAARRAPRFPGAILSPGGTDRVRGARTRVRAALAARPPEAGPRPP